VSRRALPEICALASAGGGSEIFAEDDQAEYMSRNMPPSKA
jgi:hypothetical protein